jgi:hypothetical protein
MSGMTGGGGKGKYSGSGYTVPPTAPPATQSYPVDQTEAKEKARKAKIAMALMAGRQSTILTEEDKLGDLNTQKKTLSGA